LGQGCFSTLNFIFKIVARVGQQAISYLDTYRKLTSHIIEFLKIIIEKKNPKFFLFLSFEEKLKS
jgi:hypothetical protein